MPPWCWRSWSTERGYYIVASHDGGKTFVDPPIYTTTGLITGVELSRSSPGVIYVTSINSSGSGSTLARSDDYGAHWTAFPMTVPAGTEPLIMAIDPEDADTVYLRVSNGGLYDSVVITTDGGQTFETALIVTGQFSAFLRAADGALYLGELAGVLHVRAPGATEFSRLPGPHFRCLGQRAGTSRVFACGDMGLDGFSVGYSDDQRTDLPADDELRRPAGAPDLPDRPGQLRGPLGADPGGARASLRCRTPDPAVADRTPAPPPMPGLPAAADPGQQKSGCSTTGGNGAVFLGLLVVLLLWRMRS